MEALLNKSDVVICPSCAAEITVSEAVRAQVSAAVREELVLELADERKAMAQTRNELRGRQELLRKEEKAFNERVRVAAKDLEAGTRAEAIEKVRRELEVELRVRDEKLAETNEELRKSREKELELLRRERELQTRNERIELEIETRLASERDEIRVAALRDKQAEFRLKEAEHAKKIDGMKKQIDHLQQKLEQGSQQTQGDVLELDLEQALQGAFPADSVAPVPTGVRGADVEHAVIDKAGEECGSLLWETKRTKKWNPNWVTKLKRDVCDQKASVGVIVTTTMPKNVQHFGLVDGIWVCDLDCWKSLAILLRTGLINVARVTRSLDSRQEKSELAFRFLTSDAFVSRLVGIKDSAATLQDELKSEKRSLQRRWKKREQLLDLVTEYVAEICGNAEGICGHVVDEFDDEE